MTTNTASTTVAPAATAQTTATGQTTATAQTTPPAPPSIHVRTFLTWLAIFPLVAIGLIVIGPIATTWHPVLRAFALTIVIVPVASYLVVPRLLKLYGSLQRARARR